jgi:hypothetical protein
MMENRLLGAVALLLTVWMFATALRDESITAASVPLNRLDRSQIQRILVESSTGAFDRVVLERDDDDRWWFDLTVDRRRRFLANRDIGILLERVAPLVALRSLRGAMSDRLDEIGFDPPLHVISVETRDGRTLRYHAGGRTLDRSIGDLYLKRPDRDEVFIVEPELVTDFHPPFRYRQNQFVPAPVDDLRRVVVRRGEVERDFVRQTLRQAETAFWAREDEPDVRDTKVNEAIDLLYRVNLTRYPLEPVDDVEVLVEVEWRHRDGRRFLVEFGRSLDGADDVYYGRSSAVVGHWVELTTAIGRRLVREVDRLTR